MKLPKEISIRDLVDILGREEAIQYAVDKWGMNKQNAEFILAMEFGEVEGDVLTYDPDETSEKIKSIIDNVALKHFQGH